MLRDIARGRLELEIVKKIKIEEKISDRKNIKIEPINPTLKKTIYYCDELPFKIISFNRYINIEKINIIASYDKNKEYY